MVCTSWREVVIEESADVLKDVATVQGMSRLIRWLPPVENELPILNHDFVQTVLLRWRELELVVRDQSFELLMRWVAAP